MGWNRFPDSRNLELEGTLAKRQDVCHVSFWRLKIEPFVTGSERAARSIGSEKRGQVRTEEVFLKRQ